MSIRNIILPIGFIIISSFVIFLETYILSNRIGTNLQFLITTCGEVLKNIQEHVHLNLNGFLSSLILFTAAIGIGLAIIQVVRFFISHSCLNAQHKHIDTFPTSLKWVIEKHHLQNIIFSLVSENSVIAYTAGLVRPRIVISQLLMNKVTAHQLEAIILHELYHARNHHTLWLLMMRLISSLLFFVPLVAYFAKQLKVEFELAADSFVVRKQKTREHLCSSLALNLQYVGGVSPHFATAPIEKRVASLITEKVSLEKIGGWHLFISVISVSLMIGLSITQSRTVSAALSKETNMCRARADCKAPDCIGHEISLTNGY